MVCIAEENGPVREIAAFFLISSLVTAADLPEWPQFAGPHRNFTADIKGLAASWPSSGPVKLWTRALGEGYSGIAVDGNTL